MREATRTTARKVLSAAWPVMLSYVAVGLPCGVLAAKAGMTPLMNFVLSLTFLSGGGQFMMSNLWLAGTPLLSIIASVAAISTRFALYSASLAPYLKRFGRRQSLAIACCYTEEAYGITLSRLASRDAWTAHHALGLNVCVQLTWAVSCAAGAALGSVVDIPTAIAGFAMTSLFIYLLYAQPHTRGTVCTALGAAVTVALCKWNGLAGVAVPLAAAVTAAMARSPPHPQSPQGPPREVEPNEHLSVPCALALLVRVHSRMPRGARGCPAWPSPLAARG